MNQSDRLEGKAALITGGGRGIGRVIAIAFARAGADVCVSARTRDQIEEVASEVKSLGRKGIAEVCDVEGMKAGIYGGAGPVPSNGIVPRGPDLGLDRPHNRENIHP